jgi:hypothetical protein
MAADRMRILVLGADGVGIRAFSGRRNCDSSGDLLAAAAPMVISAADGAAFVR